MSTVNWDEIVSDYNNTGESGPHYIILRHHKSMKSIVYTGLVDSSYDFHLFGNSIKSSPGLKAIDGVVYVNTVPVATLKTWIRFGAVRAFYMLNGEQEIINIKRVFMGQQTIWTSFFKNPCHSGSITRPCRDCWPDQRELTHNDPDLRYVYNNTQGYRAWFPNLDELYQGDEKIPMDNFKGDFVVILSWNHNSRGAESPYYQVSLPEPYGDEFAIALNPNGISNLSETLFYNCCHVTPAIDDLFRNHGGMISLGPGMKQEVKSGLLPLNIGQVIETPKTPRDIVMKLLKLNLLSDNRYVWGGA